MLSPFTCSTRSIPGASLRFHVILYCCADLIFATRIRSTGEAIGVATRPVRSVDRLHALLAEQAAGALIVDLEVGEVALELIAAAARRDPPLHTLAFGPHVNLAAFEAARAAGVSEAMPRGQFADRLPDLLASLDGACR